ncbi:MAG: hypothetical protein M3367_16660 [Acidobacteriota bacterium]|nr:hypothetical protein [Acidobacteriota bacterium]
MKYIDCLSGKRRGERERYQQEWASIKDGIKDIIVILLLLKYHHYIGKSSLENEFGNTITTVFGRAAKLGNRSVFQAL